MSSQVLQICKGILIIFFIYECYHFIIKFKSNFQFCMKIWSGITWTIVYRCSIVILLFSLILYATKSIKVLQISLLTIFFNKKGSLLFSEVSSENLSSTQFNIGMIILLLFITLLMPIITNLEEIAFRKGRIKIKKRLKASFVFGLLHSLMGINIISILLVISFGYYLSEIYKINYFKYILNNAENLTEQIKLKAHKQTLLTTTTYHTCFNSLILGIVLVMLVFLIIY